MSDAPKRASFAPERAAIPTIDDMVDNNLADTPPEVHAAVEAQRELDDARRGIRYDPEYRARNRAKTLLSMEVVRDYSPSERLTIVKPDDWPWEYHFCDDEHRKRVGWAPWVPLDAEQDWAEAQKVCPSKVLRQGDDGRIYSGQLVMCRAPREIIEKQRALHYQRSQRNLNAAVKGQMTAMTRGSDGTAAPGYETFGGMKNRTARAGDVGISMEGSLEDDTE